MHAVRPIIYDRRYDRLYDRRSKPRRMRRAHPIRRDVSSYSYINLDGVQGDGRVRGAFYAGYLQVNLNR